MSTETNEFDQERQSLLLFLWKKRKVLMIVTGAAFVVSIIVSLLLTPQFKATAIVFPTATSTTSFSEQSNAKAAAMDFGEEEQAEQLVQILQSSRIKNRIIKRFNLFKHYKIDKGDPNKNYKMGKAYDDHIKYTRTRFGSIQIDVWDKDRELSARIANKIVDLIDTVKNNMVQERTIPAFQINKRKKDQLELEKKNLQTELDTLGAIGVMGTEGRANLLRDLNEAKPQDRQMIVDIIDSNKKYGAKYDGLVMLRDERIVKLSKFEDSYEQSESDAYTELPHKFVVDLAVVADKKDKPKRAIVVLLATIGAFIFCIFALLVKDRITELKKAA